MKLEKLYALLVLMSGLAFLVLSDKELGSIESYYREVMRRLLRLHPKTPKTVIYFLAGSIPGNALLHQRQWGLFGMIVRLRNDNVLHQHAKNIFTAATISKGSWFHQIRKWCLMYNLPHPSVILASPQIKSAG